MARPIKEKVPVIIDGVSGLLDADRVKLLKIIERKDDIEVRVNKEYAGVKAQLRTEIERKSILEKELEKLRDEKAELSRKYDSTTMAYNVLKDDFNNLADLANDDINHQKKITRGWQLACLFLAVLFMLSVTLWLLH